MLRSTLAFVTEDASHLLVGAEIVAAAPFKERSGVEE
jgi:hypothetical protein